MQKLIADSYYDIGGFREVYEDRVGTRHLTTAGGLELAVAVVADGVGGENKGERAAQTAFDALLYYLEKSRETVIPTLLTSAVKYANKAVHQLRQETGGSSTTLAVAVIDKASSKLYIANVGDSRIYFCRNQKLTQLTMDHSFANLMLWKGLISPEDASTHPRAGMLMRAIGPRENVDVDLGFYVGTKDPDEATAHGLEGLPLKDGDAVLVCSDGLIKDSPKTHQPLIKTEEIVRTLRDKQGKKAAQELVSFALGRGSDDNISAAVVQLPDRWMAWRARRPLLIGAGAALVVVVIVLAVVLNQLSISGARLTALAQEVNATAQMLTEIAGFTSTPTATPTITPTPTLTPTPTPTLLPPVENQAAVVYPGESRLLVGVLYQVGTEAVQMKVYHRLDITNAFIYAMPGSQLTFDQVYTNDAGQSIFQFRTDPNSQYFLSTGGYNQAYLVLPALNIRFSIQGCFAIGYPDSPSEITASCYEGSCAYNLATGDKVTIASGRQLQFSASGQPGDTDSVIPGSSAQLWARLLSVGSQEFNCANRYVPTATAIPTATYTPTSPPVQQQAAATFTATKLPTSTSTATPTLTMVPTSTVTLTLVPSDTMTPTLVLTSTATATVLAFTDTATVEPTATQTATDKNNPNK